MSRSFGPRSLTRRSPMKMSPPLIVSSPALAPIPSVTSWTTTVSPNRLVTDCRRTPAIRLPSFRSGLQTLQRVQLEARGLAERDDRALLRDDLLGGGRNLARDLFRDDLDAVHVGMNQIAGPDLETTDRNRRPEVDHVHVGVRDHDLAGIVVESERLDFTQVADTAVGHASGAAQRPVDVRLDLAPKRADRRIVEVLDHRRPRRGRSGDRVPPAVTRVVPVSRPVRACARGDGVADHDAQLRKDAPDLGRGESRRAR